MFVLYFGIYKLKDFPDKFNRVIRSMEKLFLLNAYLTFAGLIFSIDAFRTYIGQSYRFGYSGIIWVQNEATIFFFISISYFYYKRFILDLKSREIYVVLLSSILLGTKGIYLFLIMLLLFHLIYHSNLKAKVVTVLLMVAIYWLVLWFLETEQAKVTLAYFASKKDTMGLSYALFSGRTLYLSEMQKQILDHWTFINYLVGGQDQSKFMVEMDLFDLFLFSGILGCIIYFLLLFTTIFNFRLLKPFNFFFFFSFMSLAFLGGHFFSSVINALYFCLISLYFYSTQMSRETLNEKDPAYQ